MAIPAPEPNFQLQREKYRELSNKFNDLKKIYPSIDVLSMGMSNDYGGRYSRGLNYGSTVLHCLALDCKSDYPERA